MQLVVFVIQIIITNFAKKCTSTEWHQMERDTDAWSSSIPMPPPQGEEHERLSIIFSERAMKCQKAG